MATITTKLTVTGSAADYGAALALSATDSLSVTSPSKGVSRFDLAVGATSQLIASGTAGTSFLYIKNNNTTGSGSIQLRNDAAADFGTLENGEWAWIPLDRNTGFEVFGVGAICEVEYAFWTRT
jgi:hypothetical protein